MIRDSLSYAEVKQRLMDIDYLKADVNSGLFASKASGNKMKGQEPIGNCDCSLPKCTTSIWCKFVRNIIPEHLKTIPRRKVSNYTN
jgi:hypothetical protein